MYTVIFTGSRNYKLRWRVDDRLLTIWREHDHNIFVKVGDCPTGVDRFVREMCYTAQIKFKEYKADWREYGDAAGPVRNHIMVDSGADLCVAYPEDYSRGTKDCAKYAHKKGIKVEFPDLPEWAKWAVNLT